jgi:hypothetical protein
VYGRLRSASQVASRELPRCDLATRQLGRELPHRQFGSRGPRATASCRTPPSSVCFFRAP